MSGASIVTFAGETDDCRNSVTGCGNGSDSGTNCISDPVGKVKGHSIRPMISEQLARQLVQRLYGLTANSSEELNGYVDQNFFIGVAKDQKYNNPYIKEISPQGYVLKVLNSRDSRNHRIEVQHKIQNLLETRGIFCPQPVLNVKGVDNSLEEIIYDLPESGSDGRGFHIVRLLTFVPGQLLAEAPYTERLLYRVGQYVASVQKALEGFSHPSLDDYQGTWSLNSVPKLSDRTYAIQKAHDRRLVEDIIEAFQTKVIPNRGQFQTGVIHGDVSDQNLLVRAREVSDKKSTSDSVDGSIEKTNNHQETEFDLCGIIDFGDVANSYYIYELAIATMYIMLESKVLDSLDVGGHILAGYMSSPGRSLNEAEFNALRVCVAARFAQSLTNGAYTYSLNPTNEYILMTARNGWKLLRRLWNTPAAELYKRWTDILATYKRCAVNPVVMHKCNAGNGARDQ